MVGSRRVMVLTLLANHMPSAVESVSRTEFLYVFLPDPGEGYPSPTEFFRALTIRSHCLGAV